MLDSFKRKTLIVHYGKVRLKIRFRLLVFFSLPCPKNEDEWVVRQPIASLTLTEATLDARIKRPRSQRLDGSATVSRRARQRVRVVENRRGENRAQSEWARRSRDVRRATGGNVRNRRKRMWNRNSLLKDRSVETLSSCT